MVNVYAPFEPFKRTFPDKATRYVFPCIAAGLATVVAGYCLGFSNPVLQEVTDKFNLSGFEQSTYSGSLSLAGAVGAGLAGFYTRHYGPYRGQVFTSFIMILGYILQAVAPSYGVLLLGRILTGLGLGATTVCTPLFLNDAAPEGHEGAFGFVVQVGIGVGILLINVFSLAGGDLLVLGWAAAGTSIASLVVFYFFVPAPPLPEKVLSMRSGDDAAQQLYAPYIVSYALMAFQQLSGINVVIFFVGPITDIADLGDPDVISVWTTVVQLASGVISLFIVDRIGKKILLFTSSFGMMASLIMLAAFSFIQDEDPFKGKNLGNGGDDNFTAHAPGLAIAAIFIFLFSFNMGLGPVPWSVVGEYFEPHQVGAATTGILNYLLAFAVTQSVDPMLNAIGGPTYLIYAAFCFLSCVFVALIFPHLQRSIDLARAQKKAQSPTDLPEKKEVALDYIPGQATEAAYAEKA
eukprot:Clim_evm1s201 gene=Clim_evmTU1s201